MDNTLVHMHSNIAEIIDSLEGRLLFAVPKKGRLSQLTLEVLKGSDIHFHRHNRLDIALVKNLPIALVFLPAADIPTFVGEGKVSLGITGRDQVLEHEAELEHEAAAGNGTDSNGVEELLDLGFGKCKLQVQVPATGQFEKPEQLVGKKVVTSFTNLARKYFDGLDEGKSSTTVKFVGGSVETACTLGVGDGVVDLVESGETMRVAGLKAISTVVESSAILIQSKHPTNTQLIKTIKSRIKGWIDSQRYVSCKYNIHRENLEAASKVAPGKRSPTVTTLHPPEDDWVAVEVMIEKEKIGDTMDRLWDIGAKDILVLPLLNTRTGD